MLKNKLGLYLVTYNRAASLQNTLEALAKSPFAGCRLTILDNCSSDGTAAVCAAYAKRFPDFIVRRHERNITGNYNYLRAVEMADTEYAWILCDDDRYDFGASGDVIAAVEEGTADAVLFWSPSSRAVSRQGRMEAIPSSKMPFSPGGPVRGKMLAASWLVAEGIPLHTIMSFWPSCIFRTSCVDSACLHEAYGIASDGFPVFPLINKLIAANANIYYSVGDMVTATAGNYRAVYLDFMAGWLKTCRTIKDARLRTDAVSQIFQGKGVVKSVARSIMSARAAGYEFVGSELLSVFPLLGWMDRLKMLFMLPLLLVPRFVWVRLERAWLSRRGY